jgi:hypothetical protein
MSLKMDKIDCDWLMSLKTWALKLKDEENKFEAYKNILHPHFKLKVNNDHNIH